MNRTVGVISLGCAKNLVDTEHMTGLLRSAGFRFTHRPEQADILIINTCGFIEPAKQESINTILEMARYKKTGRCKQLVVTGCLGERYRAELAQAMPEIDILLGVREYDRLPGLLGAAAFDPLAHRLLSTPPYSAYLRIADGCDNRCAYCAIPLIRGKRVSVPMEPLLREAKRLADEGVTELTVIAQDTSGYGADLYGKPMLGPLLSRLEQVEGLHWIRVLYAYPDTVNEALIDQIEQSNKLISYLDLPLQHISDGVLSRMNRRGSGKHIRRLMEHIRAHAPDFILRTTLMVGFPGETEQDFQELMDFIGEHPFDRMGAFAFSPEEGTAAADMPGQLPQQVKQARLAALMEKQREISHALSQKRLGSQTELLIERFEGNYTLGRTYGEAPDVDGLVRVPRLDSHRPGDYVPIRITGAGDYDLTGESL